MTETRRRRRNGGAIDAQEMLRTLDRNTYGGSKHGRRTKSELPVNPKDDEVKGIKIRYDRATDKYPTQIELLMTDGAWVKYRIEVQQPGFVAAMDGAGSIKRGYPPEK